MFVILLISLWAHVCKMRRAVFFWHLTPFCKKWGDKDTAVRIVLRTLDESKVRSLSTNEPFLESLDCRSCCTRGRPSRSSVEYQLCSFRAQPSTAHEIKPKQPGIMSRCGLSSVHRFLMIPLKHFYCCCCSHCIWLCCQICNDVLASMYFGLFACVFKMIWVLFSDAGK